MPAPIRDSVRVCASHFSVSDVPPDQLLPLAQLEFLLGDAAQADAAIARLMAQAANASASQRAWLLDLAVNVALTVRPARLDRVRTYLTQLDPLGHDAAYARLSAHQLYAGYAWSMGDAQTALTESDKAIAAFKELSQAQQVNMIDTAAMAYSTNANATSVTAGPQAAMAILDSARATLIPLAQTGNQWGARKQAQLRYHFTLLQNTYTPVGTVAKPIKADFWYTAPGDTVFPKPDRVMLAVLVARPRDFSLFATVRRLHDKYAARGLDIVFMLATEGYFRSQLESQPTDEAAVLNGWYRDYLKLPVALAIEISQFGRLPDGRRKNTPAVNRRNYDHGLPGVLVGKDGKVVMVADVSPDAEAILDQQIETALAK
jgi:hypothetical protein